MFTDSSNGSTLAADASAFLFEMNDILGETLLEMSNADNDFQRYKLRNIDETIPTGTVTNVGSSEPFSASKHSKSAIGSFLATKDPWSAFSLRAAAATIAEPAVLDHLTSNCRCDTTPSPDLSRAQHSTSQSSSSRCRHTSQTTFSGVPVESPTPVPHSSATAL